MARKKQKGPHFDIRLIIKELGGQTTMEQFIDSLGIEVLASALEKQKKLLQKLSPEKRQKLKELFE